MSSGKRKFTTPYRPLAIGLALALAAAPALAGNGESGFVGGAAAPEAADKTQGMAIMSAVLSNGALAWGAGVVSSSRESLGRYLVIFNRDINPGCSPVASSGSGNRVAGVTGPVVSNGVYIESRDFAGNLQDSQVTLVVFCPN